AFYLWIAGAVGIYLMGFVILTHIFRHKEIDISHATFGWYIPPVSKLLIPVAGFKLAGLFPQYLEFTFGLSVISFGIGFFLFLFVGGVVYHRYIYHELPISRFAATFFIGITPTAIISVILFKMVHLFEHVSILGISNNLFKPLASLGILFNWGLAAWWFIMAIVIIIYYLKKIDLPYALSWWAFTFPSGALAVSTGVTMKITHFGFLTYFYYLALAFLSVVWLMVFYYTIKGIISGKVFKPSH
ncbi:MAG: hypothetical protein KAR38_02395, partial [Calditrichia bacterium]|nr:hypothetical protein [Calditrichia bacterium]